MDRQARTAWARETLGPIFYDFIDRLHGALAVRAADGPVKALFCTRAGLRLLHLYGLYLKRREIGPVCRPELFVVSRLLAAKSCFLTMPELTLDTIFDEFQSYTTGRAIPFLLPAEMRDEIALTRLGQRFRGVWSAPLRRETLNELVFGDDPESQRLRTWYSAEAERYNAYIDSRLAGRERPVLVDTGWSGTQQRLLNAARPDYDFSGLYFGRLPPSRPDQLPVADMVGLCFNTVGYAPTVRRSVVAVNHHIIEDVLEPPIPSFGSAADIERVDALDGDPVRSAEDDHHFRGVDAWFREDVPVGRCDLQRCVASAWKRLERELLTPEREEVALLVPGPRSADFGKDEATEVVHFPQKRPAMSRSERLRRALWTQGQIALEYDGRERDQELRAANDALTAPLPRPKGRVAIITRTRNRSVLLKRAARSITRQTYDNYQWVIVNDAGGMQAAEEVIIGSGVDLRKVRIVHRPKSTGMEAASNAGIALSDPSDYLVIHDDDDSWEPDFLRETIGYLDDPPTPHHHGVVTGTMRMSEVIVDDAYSEVVATTHYNDWLNTIEFIHLCQENVFAPIAFVFSRRLYDEIGGFNEALPVLGDWEFNLQFLARSEIGVIKRPLANYFHRDLQTGSPYSNSLTGSLKRHVLYGAAIRNDDLRREPLLGRPGVEYRHRGVVLGSFARELRLHIDGLVNRDQSRGMADLSGFQRDLADIQRDVTDLRRIVVASLGGAPSAPERPRRGTETDSRQDEGLQRYQSSEINDVVNGKDYKHVQIVMHGIESRSGTTSWFDLRVCIHMGKYYIEILNRGGNFSHLGFADIDSCYIRLFPDRGETAELSALDETASKAFTERFFELVELALLRSSNREAQIDDKALLQWLAVIESLRAAWSARSAVA